MTETRFVCIVTISEHHSVDASYFTFRAAQCVRTTTSDNVCFHNKENLMSGKCQLFFKALPHRSAGDTGERLSGLAAKVTCRIRPSIQRRMTSLACSEANGRCHLVRRAVLAGLDGDTRERPRSLASQDRATRQARPAAPAECPAIASFIYAQLVAVFNSYVRLPQR